MIQVQKFNAASIIEISPALVIDGHFQSVPFHFEKNARLDVPKGGAGLYAIFYESKLIYIGKFLGTRADWTKGSILDSRWIKHLKALTLLGRDTSFSKKALSQVCDWIGTEDEPDSESVRSLRSSIIKADQELISSDMGCMVSFEKYKFAEQIRRELDDPAAALEKIELLYVRLDRAGETSKVREFVGTVENAAIDKFQPRCNVLGKSGFVHEPGVEEVEAEYRKLLSQPIDWVNAGEPKKEKTSGIEYSDLDTDEGPRFLGKLSTAHEAYRTLVEDIMDSLCQRADASVSFTDTAGGDLRVRSHQRKGVGFLNVATLILRPKKNILVLRTSLAKSFYLDLNLSINREVNDRLKQETDIDIQLASSQSAEIVKLIKRALEASSS